MINDFIIKKLENQNKLIENLITKKLNQYLNSFSIFIENLFLPLKEKENKAAGKQQNFSLKLKIIKKVQVKCKILCLCFLDDGRLVSGDSEGKIVIYNKDTYQSDISINRALNSSVRGICKLRNGSLVSFGFAKIKIWKINGNKYNNTHVLKGHKNWINKIIELESGILWSCSADKTIKIWDNKLDYQSIETLTGHAFCVSSIVELNEYIISASEDNSVRVWNKSTYQCIQIIEGIFCYWINGLSKLKDNIIILGGKTELFILDALSFQYKSFKDKNLGNIRCVCALRNGKALLTNNEGRMICFDPLSYQLNFIEVENITCMIKSEDDKIFTSSTQNISIFYFTQ